MAITQAEIDALIQFIDETETAESVTNVIVAAVLRFLNERTKAIEQAKATTDDLEAETEARVEADEDLQESIAALADRINALVIDGGLKPEDIINSTTNTAADKALAAAQGYVLRRNVVAIQEKLDALIEALANSAFSTGRVSILGSLSWGAPVSYTISQTLSGCTSSQNGNTIDGSIPLTIELTPNMGKILKVSDVIVTVAGGGSAMVTRDSSTGKVTVYVAVVTGAVSISASASVPRGYLVTRNLTHCSSSNTGNAFELSQYETVLTADSGYSLTGVTPVVTMGGVNVTSQVWNASTRTITIPVVTGDIVITATAEESHNPIVDYVLSDVVKTSGPDELEYDSTLTAVLTKGSGFHGIKDGRFGSTSVGFIPRDIIVFMGGLPLEQGVGKDFTAEASGNNITVTIPHVTANVTIMNVQWVNGSIHSDGGIDGTNSTRGVRIEEFVPIPTGCESIAVMHNFVGSGADTGVGYAFAAIYKADKSSCKTQQFKGRRVAHFPASGANYSLDDYSYIRFCAYQWKTATKESEGDQVWGTGDSDSGIDFCYLYDETHEKFIWKGRNVTALVTTPE